MKARVFVSSAIQEFREERQVAKNLPSIYPFLEMWVFEEKGASSASLEQSYQGPLEKSDVVIFLLAGDITPPLLREVDLAIQLNKRTLLILRDVLHRSQALQDVIKRLDVKYATYSGLENFSGVLRSAMENEIVDSLQTLSERGSSDPNYRVLKNAFAQSTELRVDPLIGPSSDNRFRIVNLTPSEVKLRKSSSDHEVTVPVTGIADAVQDGNEFTVLLKGRIQWLTTKNYYKLLPTVPKDDFGIAKMSSPGAHDAVALQRKLEQRGYYSQWNSLAEIRVDRYEVAYDDDGRYFRCEGRLRPGSVEILIARR